MWSSQAVVAALDDLDYHLSTVVVRSLFVFYKFKFQSVIGVERNEEQNYSAEMKILFPDDASK